MTQPFRLGFLTHVEGDRDPALVYEETLALFQTADSLGYDVAWVAEHHFDDRGGRWLPSPFPFLAAAAERTRHLRLGTSIVVMPFTPPLRIAEDAAVVDTLSGGRLELGLGSGSNREEFDAFDIDMGERHQRTTAGIQTLKAALQGEELGDHGQRLLPAAPTLNHRLWQSAASEIGAQYVARNGAGLLLSRAAWGDDARSDAVQLPVAQAHRDAWQGEGPPRLGLSRGIYPAADRAAALAEMEAGVMASAAKGIASGRFPAGRSLEYYCHRLHFAYGSSQEVTDYLASDQVLPYASDLILQFSPVVPSLARAKEMLEQIAAEIAPALGWQPHAQTRTATAV